MAKKKTQFVCEECGYTAPRWSGKCPGCGEWNTLVEESEENIAESLRGSSAVKPAKIYKFSDIPVSSEKRFPTGISEFDRVLGGGVVPAGVVLSGGEPGIGKSTLLLQVADKLALYGTVLYVSGEESAAQIKMRADRIKTSDNILLMAETNLNSILEGAASLKPKFMIVDSIQTLYDSNLSSAPGSVSQVRGCAMKITSVAKKMGTSVFIIGHVTKEGAIAGPRVLEHIVDTVLYFEGEKASNFRILRAVKNRYGSTDEIGIFEMRDTGMEEVADPDMISDIYEGSDISGICAYPATQGTRPMLLEIQALCSHTQLNIPRRLSAGIDINRLYLICAVLEKKIGLKLYNQDIFINVAGGIKIKEYASDMALATAIVSSFRNLPVSRDVAFIGEIGLAGEIRHVSQISKRLAECERMGIKKVYVPKQSIDAAFKKDLEIVGVRTLFDVLSDTFK